MQTQGTFSEEVIFNTLEKRNKYIREFTCLENLKKQEHEPYYKEHQNSLQIQVELKNFLWENQN